MGFVGEALGCHEDSDPEDVLDAAKEHASFVRRIVEYATNPKKADLVRTAVERWVEDHAAVCSRDHAVGLSSISEATDPSDHPPPAGVSRQAGTTSESAGKRVLSDPNVAAMEGIAATPNAGPAYEAGKFLENLPVFDAPPLVAPSSGLTREKAIMLAGKYLDEMFGGDADQEAEDTLAALLMKTVAQVSSPAGSDPSGSVAK
jgi:hypothetical protein